MVLEGESSFFSSAFSSITAAYFSRGSILKYGCNLEYYPFNEG
jgi:hypothetical protein